MANIYGYDDNTGYGIVGEMKATGGEGGPGSGNHGHKGRKGKKGGSLPKGGSSGGGSFSGTGKKGPKATGPSDDESLPSNNKADFSSKSSAKKKSKQQKQTNMSNDEITDLYNKKAERDRLEALNKRLKEMGDKEKSTGKKPKFKNKEEEATYNKYYKPKKKKGTSEDDFIKQLEKHNEEVSANVDTSKKVKRKTAPKDSFMRPSDKEGGVKGKTKKKKASDRNWD